MENRTENRSSNCKNQTSNRTSKQYTKLRQYLAELNDADIAGLLEELEEEDMLKVFRILPKDLAADVFSYLDMDNQQKIITGLFYKFICWCFTNWALFWCAFTF